MLRNGPCWVHENIIIIIIIPSTENYNNNVFLVFKLSNYPKLISIANKKQKYKYLTKNGSLSYFKFYAQGLFSTACYFVKDGISIVYI